jgi:hypothetical protein
MELTVTEAEKLKEKPDQSKLGFGTLFTDHMFICSGRFRGAEGLSNRLRKYPAFQAPGKFQTLESLLPALMYAGNRRDFGP